MSEDHSDKKNIGLLSDNDIEDIEFVNKDNEISEFRKPNKEESDD